jgi:hypothetical protein
MIFGIADDGDSDAETLSGRSFGNCFRGVVGSFGVNVGAEIFEDRFDARFAEENDIVDAAECSNELRASLFAQDGATRTFESADARVGIDADDENVAFAAGSCEVANVAYVKRIKTAVRKNDAVCVFSFLR